MATENTQQIPQFILHALKHSIEDEYDAIAKEMISKFEADINRRRDEVIAGVLLNVSKHMNMTEMRDRLVIEIIKVDSKKDGYTV